MNSRSHDITELCATKRFLYALNLLNMAKCISSYVGDSLGCSFGKLPLIKTILHRVQNRVLYKLINAYSPSLKIPDERRVAGPIDACLISSNQSTGKIPPRHFNSIFYITLQGPTYKEY